MKTRKIGIILNGVTGRMGTNQHLVRSILAIRQQGGVAHGDQLLMPEPILTGRNADKLRQLAEKYNVAKYSTDLDTALSDPANEIFFDASGTPFRHAFVSKAIAAGKHIYCEKPSGVSTAEALDLARLASRQGREARCRAGQALAAGHQEIQDPARHGVFRQNPLGARRVRLLGIHRPH